MTDLLFVYMYQSYRRDRLTFCVHVRARVRADQSRPKLSSSFLVSDVLQVEEQLLLVSWIAAPILEEKNEGGVLPTLPKLSWPRHHRARHGYSPTNPDSALCSRRVRASSIQRWLVRTVLDLLLPR